MTRNEKSEQEARFRAVFEMAYPALRRYASNRGLSGSDADDLVASTLEVAWAKIDDLPRGDPRPWLFAVARNVLRNKYRSDARRQALMSRLAEPEHSLDTTEAEVVGSETIRRAFEQLDEDDQELLRLVAWDDLSPSQAAVVLGCTSLAARSRLHRARNRLAALLEFDPRVQRGGDSGHVEGEKAHSGTPTEDS